MTAWAYYNEHDAYPAHWLRNLIKAGHIAPGEVDERSITEVQPDDLSGFTQCHFFAGIGIWSLAARLAGWPNDRPLWTGSCPCQPFSVAGKQKGFADERHLWPVWRDLIAVRRPPAVFGEQVAAASDWLRIVRSDLETLGYAVGAQAIQAASAGADHLRDRYWFVADDGFGRRLGSTGRQGELPRGAETVGASIPGVGQADAYDTGSQGRQLSAECAGEQTVGQDGVAHTDSSEPGARSRNTGEVCGLPEAQCQSEYGAAVSGGGSEQYGWVIGADGKARRVKPGIRLLVDGHPNRVAKLRAFGNAIDPRPAAQWVGAFLDCERLAP